MPEYVLGHHLKGEGERLALMSELLDPMHRRYLQSLDVVKPGARTLEVGCGNGSISAWLARQVAPDGKAIAVDLDLSLVDVHLPNLEFREADIMAQPVEPGGFDLVTARAVVHHVADAERAIANLVASLRPGGAILLIEPDFHRDWRPWVSRKSAAPQKLQSIMGQVCGQIIGHRRSKNFAKT